MHDAHQKAYKGAGMEGWVARWYTRTRQNDMADFRREAKAEIRHVVLPSACVRSRNPSLHPCALIGLLRCGVHPRLLSLSGIRKGTPVYNRIRSTNSKQPAPLGTTVPSFAA